MSNSDSAVIKGEPSQIPEGQLRIFGASQSGPLEQGERFRCLLEFYCAFSAVRLRLWYCRPGDYSADRRDVSRRSVTYNTRARRHQRS
jgi:hypothetical protein